MGTNVDQMRNELGVGITLDRLYQPDEQRQRRAQERKRPVVRRNITLPPIRRKAIDVHTYEEIYIRKRKHQATELVPKHRALAKAQKRNMETYPIQKSVNYMHIQD